MSDTIRIGISTCPNDTFAFHALMQGIVNPRGLNLEFELLDIQQLNDRLVQGGLDVSKVSFHAALKMASQVWVLPSGSALGFGVGPLLLASSEGTVPRDTSQITLCPGQHTTATLLMNLFFPETTRIQHVLFSEIMPRLIAGDAHFGVCIHEGRFTWQEKGLHMVEDLGTRWERETESPLPLGGLVARRDLPIEIIQRVQDCVRESILYGLSHPEETLPTMRRYAQEFNDDVLMQHVDLYVNDWTVDLGEQGRLALEALSQLARKSSVIAPEDSSFQVFCGS